ncbi:hypothetical protein QWZ13_11725 [Reinekea marina]|nr:hypothetical protein [Reinekea marina]MDN3649585.1 hypothetical protein [Reinekea marina]
MDRISFQLPLNAKLSGERMRVHSPPRSGVFRAVLLQRFVTFSLIHN